MHLKMKVHIFHGLCLASCVAVTPVPAAGDCRALIVAERGGKPTVESSDPLMPRITVEEPGRFCLERDVDQAQLKDPLRRSQVTARQEAILRIRADDVLLDLGGRTISNRMPNGMTIIWFSKFAVGARGGVRLRRASIANGQLLSPGSSGVGVDLTASMPYGRRSLQPASIPDGVTAEEFFADTNHVIQGLTIRAGKRAIEIDGRNNIIRNNRITVDSLTAIVAQGPGVVIEDNDIEIRGDLGSFSLHDRKIESLTPFSIRLIQADGAIIRNNRIRFVGAGTGAAPPAAVQLVASPGALLEGNWIGGMDAAVHVDATSSFRERDNRVAPCPEGAARYLPPGEADDNRLAKPACRQGLRTPDAPHPGAARR